MHDLPFDANGNLLLGATPMHECQEMGVALHEVEQNTIVDMPDVFDDGVMEWMGKLRSRTFIYTKVRRIKILGLEVQATQ